MKKQKICIIGGSLTGLITSIALSKLNCEIDIITGSTNAKLKSSRTTAISQGSARIFENIGLWSLLKRSAQPILRILVSEGVSEKNLKFDQSSYQLLNI